MPLAAIDRRVGIAADRLGRRPPLHAAVKAAVSRAQGADQHANQIVSTWSPDGGLLAFAPRRALAKVTLTIRWHPIRRSLVNSVRQQFRDQRKQCIRAKAGAVDQRLNLVVR